MVEKTDFKKLMKPLWQPPVGTFVVVEVPRLSFLMVDGKGDPNTAAEYSSAVQWLYTLSYGLKFASKAAGRDYGVAPLEGLWWAEDMTSFTSGNKDNWLWTAMIMQPDWIDQATLDAAMPKTRAKLGEPPPQPEACSFRRGTRGADDAHRTLQCRGPNDRQAAQRVPAGQRTGGEWPPS